MHKHTHTRTCMHSQTHISETTCAHRISASMGSDAATARTGDKHAPHALSTQSLRESLECARWAARERACGIAVDAVLARDGAVNRRSFGDSRDTPRRRVNARHACACVVTKETHQRILNKNTQGHTYANGCPCEQLAYIYALMWNCTPMNECAARQMKCARVCVL